MVDDTVLTRQAANYRATIRVDAMIAAANVPNIAYVFATVLPYIAPDLTTILTKIAAVFTAILAEVAAILAPVLAKVAPVHPSFPANLASIPHGVLSTFTTFGAPFAAIARIIIGVSDARAGSTDQGDDGQRKAGRSNVSGQGHLLAPRNQRTL